MSTKDIKESLLRSIRIGKDGYKMTKSIILPPVILGADDVWAFCYPDTEPNYVTLGCASGDILVVNDNLEKKDLMDKILLIPSADPGYDWIFTQGICGFITKYGGANSHMAIRAGELGIPAVIGIGEKRFEEYKKAVMLEINAAEKKIRVLRKK